MKIIVRSYADAFDYVMGHFHAYGKEYESRFTDRYVVISCQDTHTDGFGFTFSKNKFCKDVLTLYFNDILEEKEGEKLFDKQQAKSVIEFINKYKDEDITLLVHCFGGRSRSKAIGAFAAKLMGEDNSYFFDDAEHLPVCKEGKPNSHVYKTLSEALG